MPMFKSANVRRSVFAVALITLMLGAGCGSAEKKPETSPTDQGVTETTSPVENYGKSSDENGAAGMQTVHFPYDSFTLDSVAKSTLKGNADIMKQKSSIKIQVEGHCDQRGGIQYNIALGEKRANAVRKYLVDIGVTGDRVTTISFGKERPIDQGSSEESYAKNRRANFVITSN
jgi:peptidoglycan-associated lipoprotein